MRYLLDSVILIDQFNGIAAATAFLADNADDCSISVITRAESLAGFAEEAEQRVALDALSGLMLGAP